MVDDNQYVQAGQPLLQIDPRDYEIAIARAKANYEDAVAGAGAAQVNVPITQIGTGSQVISAQADVENARAGIAAAKQQAAASEAQVAQAEANNVPRAIRSGPLHPTGAEAGDLAAAIRSGSGKRKGHDGDGGGGASCGACRPAGDARTK